VRSYIFLACTSLLLACSGDDAVGSRPQGGTSNGSGGASTSGGGSIASGSGGNTSGSAGSTSSTGGNASTSSGAAGSTGSSGGAAGATASSGAGGSAAGRAGSGGVVVDASVETGPPPPPPDPGPLSGGGAGCNDVDPVHQGSATFYNVTSSSLGHCSFNLTTQPQPPYWLAMNFTRYNASSDCGACLQVTGPSGTQVFQVIDECPNAATDPLCQSAEHLDMSPQGFAALGGNGRIDSLTWKYVPCDVQTSNVEIFTQGGSTTFFATIGFRKHRYRVAKVELVNGTTRVALVRRSDNFFIIDTTTPAGAAGMALGPFRIRITDIYNHWIENKVALTVGQNVSFGLQFLACPAGGDAGP
jgi:expansin (peptidoglycan-binding protein)